MKSCAALYVQGPFTRDLTNAHAQGSIADRRFSYRVKRGCNRKEEFLLRHYRPYKNLMRCTSSLPKKEGPSPVHTQGNDAQGKVFKI